MSEDSLMTNKTACVIDGERLMLQNRHNGWMKPDQTQCGLIFLHLYSIWGPGHVFSTTDTDGDWLLLASGWDMDNMVECAVVVLRRRAIPVTLMATMSVGTAWAACLIFSSGVGRGVALFHITCLSTSDPSPSSSPACGVWGLMESWDLSSSADEAVDWMREREKGLTRRETQSEGQERGKSDNRGKEWKRRKMTGNLDDTGGERERREKCRG